ncbi:hypothetical protein [Pigmentiphaga sp. CHJ604]|uniref:hypothetical protein n=1 Tax=Pigmentiphaga sp. CHJ604 TaxID=3081984 RepID=UPI0030CD1AF3
MKARNDIAFGLLCGLVEESDGNLHPDAARYSGQMDAYRHLLDLGALGASDGVGSSILCPWCGMGDLEGIRFEQGRRQGYCTDCGWVDLASDQVTWLRVDTTRIVRWLASALGLAGRYQHEELVPTALWRLGEIEHRRKRRTVFFGRKLDDPVLMPSIDHRLRTACAPGCGVLLTTTADVAQTIHASGHLIVPLRAVAHLRKAGFVIENLDAYLDGSVGIGEPDSETSLRLMHSGRIALIDGGRHALSPQVCGFLSVLQRAAGDPVHKRTIADALEIDVDKCKGADIFKRHKAVYRTFVAHDTDGHYWLKPEYADDQRK